MQINHNVSAVIANNQLRKSENRMSKSVERLSSGLKINRAADDPSGMAISQKMKTQIRGLNRANDNANDGVSVLQTAEGALNEVHSILQRVRELAVQSANGTYTTEDRQAIQSEVDALLEEVDRISGDTQFNKVPLLDGSIDQRGYADVDGVSVRTFSSVVDPATYAIAVNARAEKAGVTCELSLGAGGTITDVMAGTITINGVSTGIEEGDTTEEVFKKVRDLGELVNVTVSKTSDASGTIGMFFEAVEYGSQAGVDIQWSNPDLQALFTNMATAPSGGVTQSAAGSASYTVVGVDTEIEFLSKNDILVAKNPPTGSLDAAIYAADGSKVTITQAGGFKIELEIDPEPFTADKIGSPILLDIMDIGTMVLQIGANEGETMNLKIPAVNTNTLDLEHINLLSQPCSADGITKIDAAIEMVSSVRSTIGAYQNRLDHAISNLDTSELNMENALSRIEDVDMAEEMTEYTASTVLEQAGTSVLAQANDLPEMVLQLLG